MLKALKIKLKSKRQAKALCRMPIINKNKRSLHVFLQTKTRQNEQTELLEVCGVVSVALCAHPIFLLLKKTFILLMNAEPDACLGSLQRP